MLNIKMILLIGLSALFFYEQPVIAKHTTTKDSKIALESGELIRFKATVGAVEGGYSYLLLKKIKNKHKDFQVKAMMKARTNHFFDKVHRVNNRFESYFSLFKNTPYKYKMDVDQAGTLQKRKMKFVVAGKNGRIYLSVHSKRGRRQKKYRHYAWKRQYRVPKNTRDLVSAIYHARTLPFEDGKVFVVHVFVTGKLWKVTGKMIRKEKLYSILGGKMTYVIQAMAVCINRPSPKRPLTIWITADKLRIPLKIQGSLPYIGNITAEVSGYRRNAKSRYLDGRRRGRLRYLFGRY